jgi:predicted AAA+ superfamily ATPase
METIDRFLADPGRSFFLFGPRGTGKSTWTRAAFPDAVRIDLLDLETYRTYQSRPERLLEVVRGHRGMPVVVIDEVQKVPDLLSVVHLLLEEDWSRRFVLTGSSARKLRRPGVDMLAGRALFRTAHPFMAAELGDRFRLAEALRHGLLPLVLAGPDPAQVAGSYVGLYLKEEVQAEGLVRNLGAFARFLEAISFSHAGVLSVSNVARECQVERKVVEGYVSVLEDLLLGYRIPVFAKRAKRAQIAHRKFYLFDAGVFRSLRPCGPLDRPEAIDGAALEGLVAQHLRAWIGYRAGRAELFFSRTVQGVEVDFVLYGPDGFWAIEVKNGRRVRSEDLRPLRAFRADYPECECLLLYRGPERLRIDDVLCVPCEEFLRQLRPDRGPTDGL